MRNRVSIRDIAEKVGMHHTTVSLALRASPLLKKETREKIQAVAAELGYRPDPMLSALTAYRQSKRKASFHAVIAWINNWTDRAALLANPVYRGYFDGAFTRASELGYALQEFWLHEESMTPAKLRRILHARNISGLLIAPQPQSNVRVDIDFQDFSAVAFGYSLQPRNLHIVTNHHAQTLDLAISKLLELGYRRPGYCILPSSDAGGNYIWISRMLYCNRNRKCPSCKKQTSILQGRGSRACTLREKAPEPVFFRNASLGQCTGVTRIAKSFR